jgi:hypothetical protein
MEPFVILMGRRLRVCPARVFLFGFVCGVGLVSGAVRAEDESRAALLEQRARLEKRSAMLREARVKIRRTQFGESDADEIRRMALEPLKEALPDMAKLGTMLPLEESKTVVRFLGVKPENLKALREYGGLSIEFANNCHEFDKKLKSADNTPTATRAVDGGLASMKTLKTAYGALLTEAKRQASREESEALEKVEPYLQTRIGPVIAIGSALRGMQSEGEERAKYLKDAAQESVTSARAYYELTGKIKMTAGQFDAMAIGGDLAWRGAYALSAYYESNKLHKEAETYRNNAVDTVTYLKLVADYEKDKIDRKLRSPQGREPGGIKFNTDDADRLVAQLDLESVQYDPARGKILLSGKQSDYLFDMGVFTVALRLAMEEHDPFFSLELASPADSDVFLDRAAEALTAKYGGAEEGKERFARRMTELQHNLAAQGWPEYYYATLEEFDPELFRRVSDGLDLREKLVFSPPWIRYTRFGWILFDADVAIKATSTGFLQADDGVEPASVWKISGFDPKWLHPHAFSGRANFEIDPRCLRTGSLALSEIKPRLVMVHRTPGTMHDEPPCPLCRKVSQHVSDHWSEYAKEVPAFQDLTMLFRSYVAARWLVKKYPGMAMRLAEAPLLEPDYTPIYRNGLCVLRARVVDGKLLPISDECKTPFCLGSGYEGGIMLEVDKSIDPSAMVITDDPWASDTFAGEYHGEGIEVKQGRVGLMLDLDYDPLLGRPLWPWWLGAVGAALIFGWFIGRKSKPLSRVPEPICPHCRRIHHFTEGVGRIVDLLALGTFVFAVSLPFTAACEQSLPTFLQVVAAAAVIGLTVAALAVWAALVYRVTGGRGRPDLIQLAGAGARWGGLALAVFLLSGGISEPAVSRRVIALLGPAAGEQFLLISGQTAWLGWAVLPLPVLFALSIAARWVAPLALQSRPLLFARKP